MGRFYKTDGDGGFIGYLCTVVLGTELLDFLRSALGIPKLTLLRDTISRRF